LQNLIAILKDLLQRPLPGWEGQKLLSSHGYDTNRTAKSDSKKAAVLVLLFHDDTGVLRIAYIKRPSNNPHDKHGGQISFPGGQVEQDDPSLEYTALRETYEEIGIPIDQMTQLGSLSDIYVFVSDFLVSPYVAYYAGQPTFMPQPSEVDKIITWSVVELMTTTPATKDLVVKNYTLKAIPYYDLDGETLWGATAMITSEFLEILRQNNLSL